MDTFLSRVDGGGFVNTVALFPASVHGADTWVIGGDVAGIYWSSDASTWHPAARHVTQLDHYKIAGIEPHPSTAGLGYMVTSNAANSEFTLWKTTDSARTWSQVGATVSGPGIDADGANHPRQTHKMLVVTSGGDVYIGTNDGVYKSVGGSVTPVANILAGCYITSLRLDPLDHNIKYITASSDGTNSGVYMSIGTTTDRYTVLTTPHDLLALNEAGTTVLYVAAGVQGVRKFVRPVTPAVANISTAGNWTDITGTIPIDGVSNDGSWAVIDGFYSGGATTLYVGHAGLGNTGSPLDPDSDFYFNVIWKSTNGGSTWASATADSADRSEQIDGDTEQWWLADSSGGNLLAGNGWDTSGIQINPADHNMIVISGRSGMWITRDAGVNWRPTVKGYGAVIGTYVEFNPAARNQVLTGNIDYEILRHSDFLQNTKPEEVSPINVSARVCFITATGKAYVGHGTRSANTAGAIWSNSDPWGTGTWIDEDLVGSGYTGRVRGLIVSGTTIIAGIEGVGLARKVGAGSWSTVLSLPSATETNSWDMVELNGFVYVFIQNIGLYRAPTNDLATWTPMRTYIADDKHIGGLAAVSNALILVGSEVAGPESVYRITNPSSSPVYTDVTPAGCDAPGRVTTDGDVVMINNLTFGASETVKLFRSTDGGLNFQELSVSNFDNYARFPYDITLDDTNGFLYLSLDGQGTAVADLTTGLVAPTGFAAIPVSTTQIDLSWATAAGADAYDIERDGTIVATQVVGATYSDTELSPGTQYSYRIRSVQLP